MPLTGRFYGGSTLGGGRTVQDFGLCDSKGIYQYTAKLRARGLLVVLFFTLDSATSLESLKSVQLWTESLKTDKWTPLALANSGPEALLAFAEKNALTGITFLSDYDYYQTRNWGVSHVPTLFLVAGKSGQVLQKISGADTVQLEAVRVQLTSEVEKILAAEAAAKAAAAKAAEEKAEAEKKAAEEKAAAADKAVLEPSKA